MTKLVLRRKLVAVAPPPRGRHRRDVIAVPFRDLIPPARFTLSPWSDAQVYEKSGNKLGVFKDARGKDRFREIAAANVIDVYPV